MMTMNLIIFERTQFEITNTNKYSISFRHLNDNSQKSFLKFIKEICDRSKEFELYVNIYRLYKSNSLVKIAYIDKGNLYTL